MSLSFAAALPLSPPPAPSEQTLVLADGTEGQPLFGMAMDAIIGTSGEDLAPTAAAEISAYDDEAGKSLPNDSLPGMVMPTLAAIIGLVPQAPPPGETAAGPTAPKSRIIDRSAPANSSLAGTPVLPGTFAPHSPAIFTDASVTERALPSIAVSDVPQGKYLPDSVKTVTERIGTEPLVDGKTPLAMGADNRVAANSLGTATLVPAIPPATALDASQSVSTDTVPSGSALVKLPAGAPEQWRQPLLEALGERLHVQIASRSEQAVIRLDPPMMGSIEVIIRHQAGVLQVQLNATHGEVLRQLHNIGDSLRHDLVQGQYAEVTVQVSSHGRDADGRQRSRQDDPEPAVPGRALAEAEEGLTNTHFAPMTTND